MAGTPTPSLTWEFELLSAELDRALEPARAYYKEGGRYEMSPAHPPLDHRQSLALFEVLLQQLVEGASSLNQIVKQDMTAALGPKGVPGDAVALKASAARAGRLMTGLTTWEDTVDSTFPAAHWQKPFRLLRGSTIPIFTAMEQMAREIHSVPIRARRGETYVKISVDILPPPRWEELPDAVKKAIHTGGSFIERHPIISGLIAGELLSKIFR